MDARGWTSVDAWRIRRIQKGARMSTFPDGGRDRSWTTAGAEITVCVGSSMKLPDWVFSSLMWGLVTCSTWHWFLHLHWSLSDQSWGFPMPAYSFLTRLFPMVSTPPLNLQMPCFFPLRSDEILSAMDTFFIWFVFWVVIFFFLFSSSPLWFEFTGYWSPCPCWRH